MNQLPEFVEFLEKQLELVKQDMKFAQTDEQKILLTVSIRLTEGYLEKAHEILKSELTNN